MASLPFELDSLVYILLFICSITSIIFWYNQRLNLPPGPKGWPLLGILPQLMTTHPFVLFKSLSEKYGNIVSFKALNTMVVLLSDFELIREAFAHPDICGRQSLALFDDDFPDAGQGRFYLTIFKGSQLGAFCS